MPIVDIILEFEAQKHFLELDVIRTIVPLIDTRLEFELFLNSVLLGPLCLWLTPNESLRHKDSFETRCYWDHYIGCWHYFGVEAKWFFMYHTISLALEALRESCRPKMKIVVWLLEHIACYFLLTLHTNDKSTESMTFVTMDWSYINKGCNDWHDCMLFGFSWMVSYSNVALSIMHFLKCGYINKK